jgi:phosphoribosylglycinamide formyltransferase 2
VILADSENTRQPTYRGFNQTTNYTNSNCILFGKPTTRPYRRMGVALAFGNESVEDLVIKAKQIAKHVQVN